MKELVTVIIIAQNPLDTFPRNFPVDGEVANLLATMATGHCNGIWETTRHNGLLPVSACYRLAADLLFMLRTCYGLVIDTTGSRQLVTDLLWGNWCDGFWPLLIELL